jgi:putative FmdB family regulatory protein
MPRYYYSCSACDGEFEIRHGMSETQNECLECSVGGFLTRIPQLIQKVEVREDTSTAKDRVVAAIEQNRDTLRKMKKEADNYDFT